MEKQHWKGYILIILGIGILRRFKAQINPQYFKNQAPINPSRLHS